MMNVCINLPHIVEITMGYRFLCFEFAFSIENSVEVEASLGT
jgi:hypothetical protein